MKILVDENIPCMTVLELRSMNFEVIDIRGTEHEGISDEKIWKLCKEKHALLISTDKGFRRFNDEKHYGIIIVRLKQPNRLKIHSKILYAINKFERTDWQNKIVIIRDKLMSVIKS